jgi:hypothetical protein
MQERELVGKEITDPHGETIGEIEALFIHRGSDRANWALVKTSPLGLSRSFVPLHDAQEDEDRVRIVYEKARVKAAPDVEPDGQEIDDESADALHRHYGLERIVGLTAPGVEDDIELPRETREAKPPDMSDLPPASVRHPIP